LPGKILKPENKSTKNYWHYPWRFFIWQLWG